MSGSKYLWKGNDPKAVDRMKKLFELESMMFRKQQARDGVGLHPMRLLREDIDRKRTAKERERGWINSYKGGPVPRMPFGYMDKQLVLSKEMLGREPDNMQTFFTSLNNSKGKNDVKMQGRERGWTNSSTGKEHRLNETLYGLSKPPIHFQQSQLKNIPDFKLLEHKTLENAKKLETGWVSFGREQGKGRTGSRGTLGRPRGLTSSELQSLQKVRKETLERASTADGATQRSEISSSNRISSTTMSVDGRSQREKYYNHLLVPIGTLEKSGFGSVSYRASITPECKRDSDNQLVETEWVNRHDAAQHQFQSGKEKSSIADEDVLKQGIDKEEEAEWTSAYKRKEKRDMYGLAKQRDKTANEVLKESYDKYREGCWINPLQRQKPGVNGLGNSRKSGKSSPEVSQNAFNEDV